MRPIPDLLKCFLIAFLFGLGAFLIVFGGVTLPVPGTQVLTDPREILVTLGAALTGPIGALVIGLLAGIYDPVPGFFPVTMTGHVLGALWVSLAYKKFLFEKRPFPRFLAAWVIVVVVYYYVCVLPVLVFMTALFPDLYATVFQNTPVLDAWISICKLVFPEVVITASITTLMLAFLPGFARKPLW